MPHSLQELKRQNQLPPLTDIVWHYLRLAYRGRLPISNGEAYRLLTKWHLWDNNKGEWTALGRLALSKTQEEISNATQKQKRKRLRKR